MFKNDILKSLPDHCRLETVGRNTFKIFLDKETFLKYNLNDLEFDGNNPKPKIIVETYKDDQLLYTLEMHTIFKKIAHGNYNYIMTNIPTGETETIGDRFQDSILTFTRDISNKVLRGEFNG